MKIIIAFLSICIASIAEFSCQDYSLYSNDTLKIESKYLGKDIEINLHLPETHAFAAKTTKYPVTIIFDSQNERTYPHIVHSFDLLTGETQIPESIIVGIPFNIQNRRYFTSMQKNDMDSISGIEKMELFLFEELIPQLQDHYHGSEFIAMIGHSRTAFLVNYLSYKKSSQINLSISLSGFYNNEPLSIEAFHSFLKNSKNFPNTFNYFYTSGTSLEESTYWNQNIRLDSLVRTQPISSLVNIHFNETPNANHMTNYWVSLPPILIEAFSSYNSILDTWFHEKLKDEKLINSLQEFEADLEKANKTIGAKLNPNLTHIYSLASHYTYDRKDYQTAIQFYELGLSYFPEYLELHIELIELYKILKDQKNIKYYTKILRKKTADNSHLKKSEKDEILEYLRTN